MPTAELHSWVFPFAAGARYRRTVEAEHRLVERNSRSVGRAAPAAARPAPRAGRAHPAVALDAGRLVELMAELGDRQAVFPPGREPEDR